VCLYAAATQDSTQRVALCGAGGCCIQSAAAAAAAAPAVLELARCRCGMLPSPHTGCGTHTHLLLHLLAWHVQQAHVAVAQVLAVPHHGLHPTPCHLHGTPAAAAAAAPAGPPGLAPRERPARHRSERVRAVCPAPPSCLAGSLLAGGRREGGCGNQRCACAIGFVGARITCSASSLVENSANARPLGLPSGSNTKDMFKTLKPWKNSCRRQRRGRRGLDGAAHPQAAAAWRAAAAGGGPPGERHPWGQRQGCCCIVTHPYLLLSRGVGQALELEDGALRGGGRSGGSMEGRVPPRAPGERHGWRWLQLLAAVLADSSHQPQLVQGGDACACPGAPATPRPAAQAAASPAGRLLGAE